MVRYVQTISIALTLGLALLLRLNNYAQFPIVGETADEYAWTLLGASLIQEQQPISWSLFELYKDHTLEEKGSFASGTGQHYPLVSPVFDHPPLFSLIPGLAQTLRGETWDTPASAKVMRLPMILIGVLNVALLYLISRKLFDSFLTALFPALIYGTAPLFVFSSRLVVAENALATLILLTVLLVVTNIPKQKQLILLILICTLAILVKMAGVLIPVTLIVYGITQKNSLWKAGVVGGIAGFTLFALYGAFYNWDLFITAFTTQASRGFGFFTLHNRLFLHPAVVTRLFVDGWLVTGIVSSIVMIFDEKRRFLLVSLFIILNLLFVLFFVGEQTHHAWYDFPIFPLCAVGIGYVLSKILEERKYLLLTVVWLLLLPLFRFALIPVNLYYQALELSTWLGRAFAGLGMLPWFLHSMQTKSPLPKRVAYVLLTIILVANIVAVISFQQDVYWGSDTLLHYRGFIYPDQN